MTNAAQQTVSNAVASVELFVTTQGALNAYSMATLTHSPAQYREAARQLHIALKAEMRRSVSTPLPVCEVVIPAKRKAVKKSGDVDFDAALGSIPKAKRAIGRFVVVWDDGLETIVSGVIYRSDKPETQWIAAYQAANRLRRMRTSRQYLSELAFGESSAAFTRSSGILQTSELFQELNRVRPMPALRSIQNESEETFNPPEGSELGVGDQMRTFELEQECAAPRGPWLAKPVAPFVNEITVARDAMMVVSMRELAAQHRVEASEIENLPKNHSWRVRILSYAEQLEKRATELEQTISA